MGNALGTLTFTWATVVLLGGYPTVLRPGDDFWIVTTIVFLEAARMFSHGNNRPDYQLFFRTRGAFKSLGWNGLIFTVCLMEVMVCVMILCGHWILPMPVVLLVILAIGRFLTPGAAKLLISNELSCAISLWSPMVAIILLGPSVPYGYGFKYKDLSIHRLIPRNPMSRWAAYLVLFVVVLLLTISKLRFPVVVKLVDSGRKLACWRRVIINLCMSAARVMLVSTFHGLVRYMIITFQAYALLIVSFGNLQVPAAVLRIGLALSRLIPQCYYGDDERVDRTTLGDKTNFVPSLDILYAMVLGQGILYIVACILEVFSFILRRSLTNLAGFRGPLGVEYVELYYAYAFEKCMRGVVLAPKKTSLITFAIDSIESNSPKMQFYGVQMIHGFLKKEPLKIKAISKLTTSTKTVTTVLNMLGWTSRGNKDIRLFAAKLIASLLDTTHEREIKDPLLDTNSQVAKQDALIEQVSKDRQNSARLKWWKQMVIYCLIPAEEPPRMDEQNYHKHITECRSVPEDDPSMNHDLLPALGMLIIERLATFDLENWMEINGATCLISKTIEFASCRTKMINISETDQTMLKGSSLKVLRRLTSTKGKFGVALRQKISEHPFLLSNIAEILDESKSSREDREVTAEIIRNLAMNGNTSAEIGHIWLIISRLMYAFLRQDAPSSGDTGHFLPMIAGQALAVLAMESSNNCLVMLAEPGHVFIRELTIMIHSESQYRYTAASLLRDMCVQARPVLSNSDLKNISYILREVLEGIMDAEGAELEILLGLSSQICNVVPEDFARELDCGEIKERFIKRLVDVLNSNMVPTAHCPGIRRAVVQHAVYMMENKPSYANYFNRCWMMEALDSWSTAYLSLLSWPERKDVCEWLQGISSVT
uniref:BLE2 protein n=1 Tax=Aegilops tauschii TaxID=37682 RepID=M8BJP6_AEGTA